MKTVIIAYLLLLVSCLPNSDKNLPIEIYRMSGIHNRQTSYYVIYNHRGKSDTALVNSVIDFNRRTISLDTILKYDFYFRRFYKQDKDLTKDYDDKGDPEGMMDYAERCIIHLSWEKYVYDNSDTVLRVNYRTWDSVTPAKRYHYSSSHPVDSSILNPILRW